MFIFVMINVFSLLIVLCTTLPPFLSDVSLMGSPIKRLSFGHSGESGVGRAACCEAGSGW